MIRKIAAAVVGLLLLASCQSGLEGPETGTAQGRYMEESIPFPALVSIVALDEVGPDEYYLAGYDSTWELQLWHSTDGCESWNARSPDWLDAAGALHIQCAAFAGGGSCYLVGTSWNRETGEYGGTQIYRADETGLLPLETTVQAETVNALSALPSGQLLLAAGGELVQIDPTTGYAEYYAAGGGIRDYRFTSLYAAFDRMAVVLERDDAFILIDLETGLEADRFASQPEASRIRAVSVDPNHDAVIYCSPSGVYRQTLDGVLTEKVIDGRMAAFSMPDLRIERIHMRRDGAFLVLCSKDDGGYDFRKYQFDPAAPTVPSTQLTVYSLWDNANVRLAAAAFMGSHPDVLVDIQLGKGNNDAVTLDDAVRTLNTQILAGAGPDVLILDDLPMKRYMEKKVLLDLSPGLAPLLASGELYEAVTGAYRNNEGIYAAPASFHVPIIAGTAVDGIQGMQDIVAYLDRISQPLAYVPEDRMDWFYDKLAHRWFDPDGAFLVAAFQEDLQALSLYAQYAADRTEEAPDDLFNQSVWYGGGGLSILLGNISSVDDASAVLSAARERGDEVVSLGGAFLPLSIYGVNATGPQTELAAEYVLESLGEEAQRVSIYNGIPVNRRAVDSLMARKEAGMGTYLLEHVNNVTKEQYQLEVTWFDEKDSARFLSLLDNLAHPAPNNAIIRQIVVDETKDYLSGNQALEDTIASLERKLNQYDREQ